MSNFFLCCSVVIVYTKKAQGSRAFPETGKTQPTCFLSRIIGARVNIVHSNTRRELVGTGTQKNDCKLKETKKKSQSEI